MGQFTSRAFDGDPYVDIMRALPDKELVWWVQKVIWLAEGFTIMEHFGRTYPDIFMHKCQECNGAGIVTCPSCHGYKIRKAQAQALKMSEKTAVGRLLADRDHEPCHQCGDYCAWDRESDWEQEWNKWESRLSYYDRSLGQLYNEWYEDVINEGRLDEDTQPEDEPMASRSNDTTGAIISRDLAKDKRRVKALMRRMGGHPYEHSHMIPYGVIDPAAPLSANLASLGYNHFDLPPEIHPEKFPELLLEGPDGVLGQYDREIQKEYLIMRNLDAAIQDKPKPAMFQPTAGTVACPSCQGQAWARQWAPNLDKLLKVEQPFWSRTFARMSPYWSTYSTSPASPSYSPWMSAKIAEERARLTVPHQAIADLELQQTLRASLSSRRLLGEIPTQPPIMSAKQAEEEERLLQRTPGLPRVKEDVVELLGARRPDGGVDYGKIIGSIGAALPSAPAWLEDYGKKMLPDADDIMAAADAILVTDEGVAAVRDSSSRQRQALMPASMTASATASSR